MAGLRCIIEFLFVILLREFTAAANGDVWFIYGRDGDGVTLPCKNVRHGQNQCDGTTWNYNKFRTRAAEEMIKLGKITEGAQNKSDRLNITEDCSLVFSKVTVEDTGLYFCRQYDESGLERGQGSAVELSVVSLTERRDGDDVTFICSVSTRGQCIVQVTWMYNGNEIEKGHPDLTISKSSCSANVTFNSGKFFHKTKVYAFKCRVRHNNEITEFRFRHSTSKEQPDDDTENNINPTAEKPASPRMNTPVNPEQVWIALGAVGFIALIITVVVFIRWKRRKGKERQTNGNVALTSSPDVTHSAPETSHDLADPEDVVSYASITYTNKPNDDARVRSKHDDDTVMYSTVKASSSSAAASADPSCLYATVKKD